MTLLILFSNILLKDFIVPIKVSLNPDEKKGKQWSDLVAQVHLSLNSDSPEDNNIIIIIQITQNPFGKSNVKSIWCLL